MNPLRSAIEALRREHTSYEPRPYDYAECPARGRIVPRPEHAHDADVIAYNATRACLCGADEHNARVDAAVELIASVPDRFEEGRRAGIEAAAERAASVSSEAERRVRTLLDAPAREPSGSAGEPPPLVEAVKAALLAAGAKCGEIALRYHACAGEHFGDEAAQICQDEVERIDPAAIAARLAPSPPAATERDEAASLRNLVDQLVYAYQQAAETEGNPVASVLSVLIYGNRHDPAFMAVLADVAPEIAARLPVPR